MDDPPALHSPAPITSDHSSSTSPPMLEAYSTGNTSIKVLSKGSKKWIGDPQPPPIPMNSALAHSSRPSEIYHLDARNAEKLDISLDVDEPSSYEQSTNLNAFNRRESSNASLLVEAALDSVCSEPNIDVDTTTNCTDTLNNLYTLSHTDNLPDYHHSIDMNETRDINLISPSVNDHISVTDDLSDDLRHPQGMPGIDYSTFQQEDFSPANSPGQMHERANFRDYIQDEQSKHVSPIPSPPRYDFGHGVPAENSDDSNGIGAQNLSLHKDNNIQLDLSIYKTPYGLADSGFGFRKDLRFKFDGAKDYILNVEDNEKFIDNEQIDAGELNDKDFDGLHAADAKDKEDADIRGKFDLKSYDGRAAYDLDDFRLKNYELLDAEFRVDRNFEPLVLNSELQGLDMSARSYHNYGNLNRYHHLYTDVDRPSVDLRLNYSPPPPTYAHADILRVVSIDSVDLSLRSQIANSRLLESANPHRLSLDQSRILTTDLSAASRHINTDTRLISELNNRILSDHTTNRLLANDQLSTNRLLGSADQRIISDETTSRLLTEPPRLLEQSRMLSESRILAPPAPAAGTPLSPVQYTGYSVSPTPYHPTALPPRPHNTSPAPPYHHYSAYY